MKIIFILLSLTIFLGHPSPGLAAEGQTGQNGDLSGEVFQMRESLDELIRLLKSEQAKRNEFQKLQAAISYLSFRSRSIELKQAELRYKQEQHDGLESSIEKIESDPEGWEKRVAMLQGKNSFSPPGEPKPSEVRLKLLQERLKELKNDIIHLESEILNAKNELVLFESFVQDKIGFIE